MEKDPDQWLQDAGKPQVQMQCWCCLQACTWINILTYWGQQWQLPDEQYVKDSAWKNSAKMINDENLLIYFELVDC